MTRRPPALLFTIVAVASCLLGYWLLTPREKEAAPMPWLGAWQVEVLQPLAEERLNLGQLAARLPTAELWLQPRLDGPRLLLRDQPSLGEGTWQLEAELGGAPCHRPGQGARREGEVLRRGQVLVAQLGGAAAAGDGLGDLARRGVLERRGAAGGGGVCGG